MEKPFCVYCGDVFEPSPRHKNQTACRKVPCQRAKRAAWQRHKMKTDADYRLTQKLNQKQWAESHPGYWTQYRKRNLQKAERNRVLQALRNRRARSPGSSVRMEESLIAETPLARYVAAKDVGRPSPEIEPLRQAFTAQISRTQRQSDGNLVGEKIEAHVRVSKAVLGGEKTVEEMNLKLLPD